MKGRGHLDRLTLVTTAGQGIEPYHPGTRIYLEDAPWFPHSNCQVHRVCGPYVVEATALLPSDCEPVYYFHGKVIIYRDNRPSRGPWHNKARVRRTVDGQELEFRQMAGRFDYFPYRFRIVRSPHWKAEFVLHILPCWLCR